MKAINFKQANVDVAKTQNEYNTLPSWVGETEYNGENVMTNVCCFELEDWEVESVVRNRRLWVQHLTFGRRLTPFLILPIKNAFNDAEDNSEAVVEIKMGFWRRLTFLLTGKTPPMTIKVSEGQVTLIEK